MPFTARLKSPLVHIGSPARIIGLAAAVACCPLLASGQQARSAKAGKRAGRTAPPAIEIPVQSPAQAFPIAPPPVLTPEQMTPVAPQITWDGEQLTIVTNNSTLGAVMEAIRQKTGAYIDVPAEASAERIAVNLGPGPAREVLSTLLAGTEFDYVIQASDDNASGVQNIFLTRRGKAGSEKDSTLAGSRTGRERLQRFNGARFPDQATGQAEVPVQPATSLADVIDSKSPESDQAASAEPKPVSTDDNNAGAPSQQLAAAGQPGVAPQPAAAPDNAVTAASEAKPASPDAAATSSQANATSVDPAAQPATANAEKAEVSPFQQKIMDMQSLFEQRRQMQQQASKQNSN